MDLTICATALVMLYKKSSHATDVVSITKMVSFHSY